MHVCVVAGGVEYLQAHAKLIIQCLEALKQFEVRFLKLLVLKFNKVICHLNTEKDIQQLGDTATDRVISDILFN
jgi:hypothetical protein